jgi:hypothetical protein
LGWAEGYENANVEAKVAREYATDYTQFANVLETANLFLMGINYIGGERGREREISWPHPFVSRCKLFFSCRRTNFSL